MIEGWIVRTTVNGVEESWLVKGYSHPEEGLVAVPYRRGGLRLEPFQYHVHAPNWTLKHVKCTGRTVPVLEWDRITGVVDPETILRVRLFELPESIRSLLDVLNPDWAGLTGSWAVYVETPDSDVDLLVYGEGVYKALEDLGEEGLISQCRRGKWWHSLHPEYRSGLGGELQQRLLDSCIRGYPYTIRILRRTTPAPCSENITYLGKIEGPIEISTGWESHLTPARYRVRILGLDSSTEAILETWHTRYMELPGGLYRARLSLFLDSNGRLIVSPDIDGSLEPAV